MRSRFVTLFAIAMTPLGAAPITFTGIGAGAVTARDNFRTAIGGGTVAGANGSFGGVRREINWDGVPDNFASPNDLPANFFNVNSPRGVVFGGEATRFQVSADDSNPTATAPRFGNFNAQYSTEFATFSPQRLFASIDSNLYTNFFFVPGTTQAGAVGAFGVMFTDVDLADLTFLQFNLSDGSSQTFFVPASPGSGNLSFLGVQFNAGERVVSVRVGLGNVLLGAAENPNGQVPTDAVAADDFIYAEPTAVPEPSTLALLGSALIGVGLLKRRRT